MPSKLARMFKRLTVEPVAFDPSVFGDDLARRTDWGPASGGGASFGTHRLVGVDPHRMEFKATPGAIAFYALFLVIGLAVLNGFSYALASGSLQWEGRGLMRLLPIALGATFAIVGGGMLYTGAAPIVFDRRSGEYWRVLERACLAVRRRRSTEPREPGGVGPGARAPDHLGVLPVQGLVLLQLRAQPGSGGWDATARGRPRRPRSSSGGYRHPERVPRQADLGRYGLGS